jgi:hypothetical protein
MPFLAMHVLEQTLTSGSAGCQVRRGSPGTSEAVVVFSEARRKELPRRKHSRPVSSAGEGCNHVTVRRLTTAASGGGLCSNRPVGGARQRGTTRPASSHVATWHAARLLGNHRQPSSLLACGRRLANLGTSQQRTPLTNLQRFVAPLLHARPADRQLDVVLLLLIASEASELRRRPLARVFPIQFGFGKPSRVVHGAASRRSSDVPAWSQLYQLFLHVRLKHQERP